MLEMEARLDRDMPWDKAAPGETIRHAEAHPHVTERPDHPSVGEVGYMADRLRGYADDFAVPDALLVDLIRALEELKSAAAAAQARATASFDASQRQVQAKSGVPAGQLGRGIAAQIALARRDSPHRGSRYLGLGTALVHEMLHTLDALSRGVLNEWRATLLVRETACLDLEDRRRIDAQVCGDPSALEGIGDRKLVARVRTLTQAIDPASQVRRHAKALADRTVSCRPAPDTMAYLTGLLPVAQGVAVYAALSRTADGLRAAGDERGRGQIMADTLVERVTGQSSATEVPVEVQLVITDRSLFARLDDPAYFAGYGIVPAKWARELIGAAWDENRPLGRVGSASSPSVGVNAGSGRSQRTDADREADLVSLRRLFMDPVSGELVSMESKARRFPSGLARLIRTRDQTCRTPWCDAPIRHIDHIRPHAAGGPTSYANGQGLCETCNHAKEAPGWRADVVLSPERHHTVRTTTPTGHAYRSLAPPLPGASAAMLRPLRPGKDKDQNQDRNQDKG